MDAANLKKQLKIKTGVVKRLTKEERTYIQEAEEQRQRIEKYKQDGKDEWHVNKQKEVLQDTLQMVPDCRKRLQASIADLSALLGSLPSSGGDDVDASEEATAAREVLRIAEEQAREALAAGASS